MFYIINRNGNAKCQNSYNTKDKSTLLANPKLECFYIPDKLNKHLWFDKWSLTTSNQPIRCNMCKSKASRLFGVDIITELRGWSSDSGLRFQFIAVPQIHLFIIYFGNFLKYWLIFDILAHFSCTLELIIVGSRISNRFLSWCK